MPQDATPFTLIARFTVAARGELREATADFLTLADGKAPVTGQTASHNV